MDRLVIGGSWGDEEMPGSIIGDRTRFAVVCEVITSFNNDHILSSIACKDG